MAPTKLIIDTDPGNDDMFAMLLALASSSEAVEVPLISVTYGNVEAEHCLRNVVTMFSIIEKEMAWRRANGLPEGFDSLRKTRPVVAVGANAPLGDQRIIADYFHGRDGLAETHSSHPHFTPAETWRHLFERTNASADTASAGEASPLFTPSKEYSWRVILQILRDNPPDTISIAAIGPLTNLALAASEDSVTLLRAKEILVMGGAIHQQGNITPLAEFNTFADAHAAAYVYALSSPNPKFTEPPRLARRDVGDEVNPDDPEWAALTPIPSPAKLGDRRLNVILFPLDITERHLLSEKAFDAHIESLIAKKSPLATWMHAWAGATFRKAQELHPEMTEADFQLHDPMTIWYAIDGHRNSAEWTIKRNVDLRVESAGQWSRGACIVDRRGGTMRKDDDGTGPDPPGDHGGWNSLIRGNRLGWCVESPGRDRLAQVLLDDILPLS